MEIWLSPLLFKIPSGMSEQNNVCPSVTIVGAGPAGLATAASLKRRGIPFRLLDRSGKPGGSFREVYRRMKLLSPRRYVNLPHLPYPGREDYPKVTDYENYLKGYAGHFELSPEAVEVTEVKRIPGGFKVINDSNQAIQCRFVVTATGIFSHPVWPQIEALSAQTKKNGSPIILHAHDWAGPELVSGGRILIIGAGVSGVSIAEECAKVGLSVMVSRRSERTRLVRPRILGLDILHWFRPAEFLPRAIFGKLCERGVHPPAYDNGYRNLVKSGKITELCEVKRVIGRMVEIVDGSRHEVDAIVVATGFRYSAPFLPPEVSRAAGGHPMVNHCESPDWPGLFFVGAPCGWRIDSEFLRGIARDAVRVSEIIGQRLATPSR